MDKTIFIAVASWVGGILAAVIVQQILNRRGVLSYFVQHFSVGTSAKDQTFGNVKVTWNDSPVTDLYLSIVELKNESSKDLENVRAKAIALNSILLTKFPQLVGTSEFVKYAPEFDNELTVAPGEQASERQLAAYRQRR